MPKIGSVLSFFSPARTARQPVSADQTQQPQPSPVRKKIAGNAYNIFLNELIRIHKTDHQKLLNIKKEIEEYKVCTWFERELFLDNFDDKTIQTDPYHNKQKTMYFIDEPTNELFIFMCQELAWQFYYYLSTAKFHIFAIYNPDLQEDSKSKSGLGFIDYSRRKTESESEDCYLSSLALSTNSSSDDIGSLSQKVFPSHNHFKFLLTEIKRVFDDSYDASYSSEANSKLTASQLESL